MLPFAALGWITPVWAAVGMSISSLTVVLNALRLTRLPATPQPSATTQTRPLPA
jgi:Cu2+-exporting ATPase